MRRQVDLPLETPPRAPRCVGCMGAATSISSADIPELLELVGRRIGVDAFMTAAAARGFAGKCFWAPLSAVRICKGRRLDT